MQWLSDGDNYTYTQGLVSALKAQPDHEVWMYNYGRPGSGTSNTKDDGVAMRTFGWIQDKMQISHHFYWWANIDSQGVDLLTQACTWGCDSHPDGWWGQASPDAFTNGNGVLLYPGTDNNPGHTSYGVNGPLGSIRLKEWRRGLQDAEYLALARQVNPTAVQAILQQIVPKVLWENQAPNGDISATRGQVSWSSDPDTWEAARDQLASIIAAHCAVSVDAACIGSPGIVLPTPPITPNPPTPVVPVAPTPTPTQPVSPDPTPTQPVVPDPTPAPVAPPVSPTAPSAPTTSPLLFVPTNPCRVLDTRRTEDGPMFHSDETRSINITGGGCHLPATAKAFALNITVVPQGQLDYLTVWPSSTDRPLVSNLNSYDGRIKANAAIVSAGSLGAVNIFSKGNTDVILDVNGYFVDPSEGADSLAFYPLPPCRVVDTRMSNDSALHGPYIQGGTIRSFPLSDSQCGVPQDARAYALNFTAVPHTSLGWMTAWPTGDPIPLASTLNAPKGPTANAAIIKSGVNGSISSFVHDDADVIADINGYFSTDGTEGLHFYLVQPCRAFDSRINLPPLNGALSVTFPNSSCGIPSSAKAVVLNATVVPTGPLGYLTLWPAGGQRPTVSTLNAYDGQVTSNLAIVPSPGGQISAFVTDPTFLILDVFGYFQ